MVGVVLVAVDEQVIGINRSQGMGRPLRAGLGRV